LHWYTVLEDEFCSFSGFVAWATLIAAEIE
jgi:hypothetical protein